MAAAVSKVGLLPLFIRDRLEQRTGPAIVGYSVSTPEQGSNVFYVDQRTHQRVHVNRGIRQNHLPANGSGTIFRRRPGTNFCTRAFWEGSGEVLQHIVDELNTGDGTGTLSQIESTVGPAIDATTRVIDASSQVQKAELLALAAAGWVYITAAPGILFGAFDTYVKAPFQGGLDFVRGRKGWNAKDFIVGEWIGEGSFGTVYTGALLPKSAKVDNVGIGKRTARVEELKRNEKYKKVVLKKVKFKVEGAEECAEMEEWFNCRVCRAAPDACAEYLGSFVSDTTQGQFVRGGKWLVWNYEGTMTLANFMKQPNFPENLERIVFGPKGLAESNPVRRHAIFVQKLMRQLLTSVKKVHTIGIVHRDIKPSNLVVSESGQLKIIDFGAAVDLRTGKNFVPDRGMLDPDYCPPELFIMPEKTPKPPPAPVAAALSPFVCVVNSPDRFDTYSVGVILMQLACPSLRTAVGLQSFKSEMEKVGYDLDKWRRDTKMKVDFEVLDLDGGKAWDLARKLIRKRGIFKRGRLSAAAALRHRYFFLGRDQVASVLSKVTPTKKNREKEKAFRR